MDNGRTPRRVLVCGGRRYNDRPRVRAFMAALARKAPGVLVTHGACPTGADRLADEEAKAVGLAVDPNPAPWGKMGRAAGPFRNGLMVRKLRTGDMVFAFPGGGGTRNCCEQAVDAGLEVFALRGDRWVRWWP